MPGTHPHSNFSTSRLLVSWMVLCLCQTGFGIGQEKKPLDGNQVSLPALMVGSEAPPLKVEAWLRNDAFEFKKGEVYLIEFWGTQCGPCLESLPKLQELLAAHTKDLTIAAISIQEESAVEDYSLRTQERVQEFMEKNLKNMTFHVAYDGAKQQTETLWMKAAEQEAIPMAYLVDRKGRIAYIGHPLSPALKKALDEVMKDAFDLDAASKKYRERVTQQRVMAVAKSLFREGKLEKGIQMLDELAMSAPNCKNSVNLEKFQAYLDAKQPDNACREAEKVLAEPQNGSHILDHVADSLCNLKPAATSASLDIAQRCAQRAVEMNREKYPVPPATLARVYWLQGNSEQAIHWQKIAVDYAAPEYKKNFEPQLAEYLNKKR